MTQTTGTATGQSTVSAVGGHAGASNGHASGSATVAAASTWIIVEDSQAAIITVGNAPQLNTVAGQSALVLMGSLGARFLYDVQQVMLVSTQVEAKFELATEMAILTTGAADMTDMDLSQNAVLVLARTNPDKRQMRAWSFYQDGHWFYVLHLGALGTIVFDTLTRKWSEWQSLNYNNWRANCGTNWNEDILGGSIDSNVVFQISADYSTDLDDPIVSYITGSYPMRMRKSITCDEVMVTSSVGMSGTVNATMALRTSDDYGLTWQDWGALPVDTATPKTQMSWQSLGEITAPGRLFELMDSGAARRVNSMEMFTRDEAQNG